jgi:hypothetical protein
MALTINSSTTQAPQPDFKTAVSVASLAKTNQELEGKMALDLLGAAGNTASLATPTATSGNSINIKV